MSEPGGKQTDSGRKAGNGAVSGGVSFDGMRLAAEVFGEGRRIYGALVRLLVEPTLRSYLNTVSREPPRETPTGDAPKYASREAEMVELLRRAQHFLLAHPLMAQTAFSALVSEGRRFATSEEGARWQQALEGSALVCRARQLWSATTLNVLEERRETVVPSAYLEVLHSAAELGEQDLEQLVSKLAGARGSDEPAA